MVEKKDQLAIVVAGGSFDKAMMPFIMGNVGAAMGMEVHLFFTFFGLPLLKKGANPKLPGMMRFFTGMILKKMKKMKISGFQDQLKTAMDLGVKVYACNTSMGILGFKKEDLMPGVKLLGAARFLEIAGESSVQLFVS